jgi:uncharacterized damage-inducible protein DinB
MALKDALLPEFDHEMALTRRVLERVPFGDAAWRPHAKSMTLGELATHLVELPTWAPTILTQRQFDMGGQEDVEEPPAWEADTLAALLAAFDKNALAARRVIADTSDAQFMEPWTLKSRGQEVFTLPKVAVLRSFILSHVIHHRGQLSVYLRLRDVPVPSIYGPSADER